MTHRHSSQIWVKSKANSLQAYISSFLIHWYKNQFILASKDTITVILFHAYRVILFHAYRVYMY